MLVYAVFARMLCMRVAVAAADELFASDEHYLLGRWLSDARALGRSDTEKQLLEWNARTQVTLWGPPLFSENKQHTAISPGSPQDYAGKSWAGLFKDFYLPRQQLLVDCAKAGAEYVLDRLQLSFSLLSLAG
jgi:alpha-N-acetylglucosaminidase